MLEHIIDKYRDKRKTMWYLYKITCTISNEYYFGVTKDVNERRRKHFSLIRNLISGINLHHPFQKVHYCIVQSLRKHGVDCAVIDVKHYLNYEVIFKSSTKSMVLYRERKAIYENRRRKKCLNI